MRTGIAIVGILFVVGMPLGALDLPRQLPDAVRDRLMNAASVTLLSLDPDREHAEGVTLFRGWRVLGETEIPKGARRKRLVDAIAGGIRASDGRIAKCFNPRHGVSATDAGGSLDLVICFECLRVEQVEDRKESITYPTTGSPQALLDKTLRAAKVKLAPKPRD